MPAQRYSQYFNIDEKYYAVVTKELIDAGKVKWEGFYPHETFIQLLHQVVTMLSGKETKSIWVEGTYGTGKSHATLTLNCLLKAPEEAVRAYFKDYGLSDDLCNKFLAARSEEMNGKLIVVHRIGSSNIKNHDDLIWAVQDSASRALRDAGVENMAAGTMKEALLAWINERPANKEYLASLIAEVPQNFGGMGLDMILQILQSDDEKAIETLMEKLVTLCRKNGILAMNMDAEKLAAWLEDVIDKNGLGAIVFIWDEFSEYFKNCQNSLTGFQTLTQVSFNKPFYFVIVIHESDGLIANQSDRTKISNRFIEPRVHIELPDNMAFQLMAQAMKETDDPVMRTEWTQVKQGLNSRLGTVRNRITTEAKKHAKAGAKTILSDDDLQKIVPLHPYAALMLKHISRVFTASQRSMFDFIVARDPDADRIDDSDENIILACRAFKWFITWKVEGEYWGDTANQSLIIVQLKKKVEEVIRAGFDKNGCVLITDILSALSERPYGFTPSNLSAFVLGFLLKEYATDQYFWSNGTTRPMSVDLMKSAIKNAMDQVVTPKAGYRPEAIVTMSEELRLWA